MPVNMLWPKSLKSKDLEYLHIKILNHLTISFINHTLGYYRYIKYDNQ